MSGYQREKKSKAPRRMTEAMMQTGRLWFDSHGKLIVRKQFGKQFIYAVDASKSVQHTKDCQAGNVLEGLRYMTIAESKDSANHLVGVIELKKAKHFSEVRRKLCCVGHVEVLDRYNFQVVEGTKQRFVYKGKDSGFSDEVQTVEQVIRKKHEDPITVPVKIESEVEI